MTSLELKIPPPIVTLVLALAMWGISRFTPTLEVNAIFRVVAAVLVALVGGAFTAAGVTAFRRANTTLDPTKPEAAASLITSGIYRVTRNPMYVGLLFILIGWTVFLRAPWAMVGPVAFVAYMTRFQIAPEERALASTFGEAYASYKARVRRWL